MADDDIPEWVDALCHLPDRFRSGGVSSRALVEELQPDLSDGERVTRLIRQRLAEETDLVESWQQWSYDKRSSPSPYLDDREVGYFDGIRRDVVTYDNPRDACAEFIVREIRSILGSA